MDSWSLFSLAERLAMPPRRQSSTRTGPNIGARTVCRKRVFGMKEGYTSTYRAIVSLPRMIRVLWCFLFGYFDGEVLEQLSIIYVHVDYFSESQSLRL